MLLCGVNGRLRDHRTVRRHADLRSDVNESTTSIGLQNVDGMSLLHRIEPGMEIENHNEEIEVRASF